MKNVLKNSRLLVVGLLLCALVITVVFACADSNVANAQTQVKYVNSSMKETETSNFAYSDLERPNIADKAYLPAAQEEEERYPGIVGTNAIKKTMDSEREGLMQWHFDDCFTAGKTYNVSFYIKVINPAQYFNIIVYYQGKDGISKNDKLEKITTTRGEWLKYSFDAKMDNNLATKFILTLEPKTASGQNPYDELYFDQFEVYEIDEKEKYFYGMDFNEEDWDNCPEMTPSSFVEGGFNVARTIKNGTLTSKMLSVPQDGVLRLALAIKRSVDASVKVQINDVIGTLIDEKILSNTSLSSTYQITSGDLSAYKFVTVSIVVSCTEEDGFAQIGLIEMIEHTHDFFGQSETLLSDCQSKKTCADCNLEIVLGEHSYEIEPASCKKEGKKKCSVCSDTIVLEKTSHVYPTCSEQNDPANDKSFCLVCNKARKALRQTHDLKHERISDTQHRSYCTFCSYEETFEHQMDSVETLRHPSFEEEGYALTECSVCVGKKLVEVPHVDKDGSDVWTKIVVSSPTCTEAGETRYDYTLIDVSVTTYNEAHGHEYEQIKKNATCTEDGVSLHHKCTICQQTKENEENIRVIEATGHVVGEWVQTKDPTLEQEGARHRDCTVCNTRIEEMTIPKLNETDYTKYALENHDEENGYYLYYSNDTYGLYQVWVEGTHINKKIITIVLGCFGAILGVVLVTYLSFVFVKKKKVGNKK